MFTHVLQNSLTKTLCGVFVIVGLFLALYQTTHAQITSVPRFTANEITLDINPENPDAFQQVTIDLETFAIDIDLYTITWLVNGEEVLSGVGEKSFTTRVGQYGDSTKVDILIQAKDGRIVRKATVLRPATVDILWEAYDSYVPPFYKGKALPSRGSIIKATAIPNLVIGENHLPHNELDYTWRWNYRVKDTSSGFDRQFMAIKNLFTNREEVLSVEVQNLGGNIRGEGETTVVMREPDPLFYSVFPENNQYDLSRRLSSVSSTVGEAVNVSVAPYFFSIQPGATPNLLSYEWQVNNSPVSSNNQSSKNQLSVASTTQGSTELKVNIEHPQEDFQFASESLNLISR